MSEAACAREAAGFSLEQATQSARICPAYLRRIERSGGCSYPLAMRLSRLYRCSANVFIYSNKGSETPTKQTGSATQQKDTKNRSKKKPEAGRLREEK